MGGRSRCDASDKGEVRSIIHKVFMDMCYLLYPAYPCSSLGAFLRVIIQSACTTSSFSDDSWSALTLLRGTL